MIWRQLLRLLLRAVSGLLWVGAGIIVKQARRVEQLAQTLLHTPEPPSAGSAGPPAHWLEAARSPGPPQHWVDRVRRGAPHLLSAAPDAAPTRRRTAPQPRGAGTGPGAKRATQPSQETNAGKAAEAPLRMRIHVLDDDGAPPTAQKIPPAARAAAQLAQLAQTPGSTAAGQAPARREEVGGAETTARNHGRSAAAEAAPSLPRRDSVALSAPSSPAAGSGAGGSPPPLSSSGSGKPEPRVARTVQQEPPTSRTPATHEAAEESTFSQPALSSPASGSALEDARSAGAAAAAADPIDPDAARKRRHLRAPAEAAPPESGTWVEAGTALPMAKRPAAPQARWAEAPGATEAGDHAPPSEDVEHWPSLPSPPTATSPPTEAVLRIWKHRRRLDDEQRGVAWNG